MAIALAIADTDNNHVRQDVVDIALALPPNKSVQLIPKIQKLAGEVVMLLPEKIGELAAYLAQEGEVEQAFALTETLLVRLSDAQTSFDHAS